MQMQKKVGQHHDRPVAPVVRRRVTEYALPDLRAANVFADGHVGSRLSVIGCQLSVLGNASLFKVGSQGRTTMCQRFIESVASPYRQPITPAPQTTSGPPTGRVPPGT